MSTDADAMMPPADSGKVLSAAEKDVLRRWIEQGAKYQPHWAFKHPSGRRSPRSRTRALCNNPIDAFRARSAGEGKVEPSPRASKERLIRRLCFDLTGLPPTLAGDRRLRRRR